MKPTPIQVYTDQYGNRHIRGKPYKSRSAAMLFDPFVMRKAKASFGSQYKDRNGSWIWGKAKIGYRAKQESDKVFDSVGNFILTYKDQGKRLDLFKNALQSKILGAKSTTSEYNIEQLAEYFPWMMSCNLLFDPLRQYIYCLSHDIAPQNASYVGDSLPPQMINSQVNKAIYQCVKVNGSLLQNAKAIYQKNNIGVLIKGYRQLLATSKQFKDFMANVLKNTGSKIYKIINNVTPQIVMDAWDKSKQVYYSLKNYFSTERTEQNNLFNKENMRKTNQNPEEGAIKFFDELIDQVFRDLRIYGDIVISFGYLKNSAQRRFLDGRLLYYYLERPNLLFSIQNSFAIVYQMDQNNVITQIPQGNFNIAYLRKIVANQVVGLGGRMMKTIKDEITKPDDQLVPFKRFQKKYLNWNEDVPEVSKDSYKDLDNNTIIKKSIMSDANARNLIYAYEDDEDIPKFGYGRKKRKAERRSIQQVDLLNDIGEDNGQTNQDPNLQYDTSMNRDYIEPEIVDQSLTPSPLYQPNPISYQPNPISYQPMYGSTYENPWQQVENEINPNFTQPPKRSLFDIKPQSGLQPQRRSIFDIRPRFQNRIIRQAIPQVIEEEEQYYDFPSIFDQ